MKLPSICVATPTWNRGAMLEKCIHSLLFQDYTGKIELVVMDDQSTDNTASFLLDVKSDCDKERFPGPRELRLVQGPGRSNWRPGAIHWPVFNAWLTTKCDLITYQFSDEWSADVRFRLQVQEMAKLNLKWSYCSSVAWTNEAGVVTSVQTYQWAPSRVPSNHLMTPTLLIDRKAFFEVGGLDFPIHAAAKAEEWIITHASFIGTPAAVTAGSMYFFRVHDQSLGNGQKPGSNTYKNSIEITGFEEQDHWALWNRVGGIYDERVTRWRATTSSR